MTRDGDEGLFARWSARKRAAARQHDEAREEPAPERVEDSPPTATEQGEDEDAILARLGLPKPEALRPGDDVTRFMAKEVPDFLRRRALRTLWRSNPVLANLDGLNDYDEDFTSPEMTKKVLATAYQVGRGIVSKISETPAEAALEPDTAAPPSEKSEEQEMPATVAEDRAELEVPAPDPPSDEPAPLRPRRMTFS